MAQERTKKTGERITRGESPSPRPFKKRTIRRCKHERNQKNKHAYTTVD